MYIAENTKLFFFFLIVSYRLWWWGGLEQSREMSLCYVRIPVIQPQRNINIFFPCSCSISQIREDKKGQLSEQEPIHL